jgi:hypothetical protein
MEAKDLNEQQSGKRDITMPGLDGAARCARALATLARTQSAAGPSGGRTTNTGGNTRRPGSNNGSRECSSADYIGKFAVRPWRITGICRQGGICKNVDIETRPVLYAAHAVLVAVRKHDDVAPPRPVLITVINGNPAARRWRQRGTR